MKLWNDIIEAYKTFKETEADDDENAEENLILLISVAQDFINAIIKSEEPLNVININMK